MKNSNLRLKELEKVVVRSLPDFREYIVSSYREKNGSRIEKKAPFSKPQCIPTLPTADE